jgi:hypothetical protein
VYILCCTVSSCGLWISCICRFINGIAAFGSSQGYVLNCVSTLRNIERPKSHALVSVRIRVGTQSDKAQMNWFFG